MRLIGLRTGWWLAIALAAAACAPIERDTVTVGRVTFDTVGMAPVAEPEFIRAAPEEVAERAVVGGLVGAMLGAGVGATASPNPAIGAIVGGPTGAVLGAIVGMATTRPLPSYALIAVPTEPVIPEFYDTWPPGYRSPPVGTRVPPPPPQTRWVAARLPPLDPNDEAIPRGQQPELSPAEPPAAPLNLAPSYPR
jgi:hypothetical protein